MPQAGESEINNHELGTHNLIEGNKEQNSKLWQVL